MLVKRCDQRNGRVIVQMAQRVNPRLQRPEVYFPSDQFGNDGICLLRKAVYKATGGLPQLGQNISTASTHERIVRLAPCCGYVEYLSCPKSAKRAHGFPGRVIIVIALEGGSEKIVKR